MRLSSSLIGGLGGAVTLTLLQELLKKMNPDAPRLDLLGKQATAKLLKKKHLSDKQLYNASLAGDLLFNSLYYSLAGIRTKKAAAAGGFLGTTMGLAAVMLPKLMDLSSGYTGASAKRKYMTMGLYLAGGLVAAGLAYLCDKKQDARHKLSHNGHHKPIADRPILDITV
ncbi:hypothetical protein [uncultured Chitinophaga sp.]|jgi:hypothetical protein|uniref:hypothetical protein n=1 Tax=uncultured Chitinophaga sp. TaxID=339340 RepID=UPI0026276E0D|nr:hypothetical protein [uncultured Chitinophaga sp.]